MRVVSIVAERPNLRGTSRPRDEADEGIESVMTALENAGAEVYRAHSVETLAIALRTASVPSPPEVFQIIGHGAEGVLSLGHHWTNTYATSTEHYVLDSNPFVYGVLSSKVEPPTEVRLLGCAVGAVASGAGMTVADGWTLLFDLARMWGTTVGAPEEVVVPSDFIENGVFPRDRLVTSDGERVRARGSRERARQHTEVAAPQFSHILSAAQLSADPLRAKLALGSTELGKAICGALTQRVECEAPILGLAEMKMEVKWGGRTWIAETFGGGRFVRLHHQNEPVVHLIPGPKGHVSARTVFHRLLDQPR